MREVVRDNVWREGLRFGAGDWEWAAGARQLLGLGLAFAAAWATFNLQIALAVLLGAFVGALKGMSGPSQMRGRLLLAEVALLSAGVFLSIRVSSNDLSAALVPGAISAVFALISAANPFYQSVMLSCISYVVVYAAAGISPQQAWIYAAAIAVGGLWQFVYLTWLWPLRSFQPEWDLLASLYRSLARGAEGATQSQGGLFIYECSELLEAQNVATDRFRSALLPSQLAFQRGLHAALLLDAALTGWARELYSRVLSAEVTTLNKQLVEHLDRRAAQIEQGEVIPSDAEAGDWADWAVRVARADPELGRAAQTVERAFAVLQAPTPLAELRPTGYRTLWQELSGPLSRPRTIGFSLFFGLTVAALLYAVDLLDLPHGHWLVMTYALIMSSDYQQVLARGLARVVGTVAGVLLLAALQALFGDALALRVLWLLLALYAMLSGLKTGYGVVSFGFTLHALAILSSADLETALPERLSMTFGGVLAALVMYRLWPTWRRHELHNHLEDAAEHLSDLLQACRRWGVDPYAPVRARHALLLLGQDRAALHRNVIRAHLEPRSERRRLAPQDAERRLKELDAMTWQAAQLYAELSTGTRKPADISQVAQALLSEREALHGKVRHFKAAARRGPLLRWWTRHKKPPTI